jgi:hypothetical protein
MVDVPADRHSPVRPVLAGDIVDGRTVAGFAWVSPEVGVRTTHVDDRLLFEGDEALAAPPQRPVPQTLDGAVTGAPMPPADLPHVFVRPAASVDPAIELRAGALLDLPGAPWQPVARTLFAAVHGTGHRLWLAGGTARDIVAGVPARDVRDLDLSGTVPAGRFTDIAYQSLRASQMSEYRTTVTPHSLVCAVVPPRSKVRLFEYRGLKRDGFRFPAVGSALAEDARQRDFTFNTLLYDVMDHVVLDPGGHGLDHLLGERRLFQPLATAPDAPDAAKLILRAMKFALRWDGHRACDLTPLHTWIGTLPLDLCRRLPTKTVQKLRETCKKDIDAPAERQLAFAATMPQPARELLELLIGRG